MRGSSAGDVTIVFYLLHISDTRFFSICSAGRRNAFTRTLMRARANPARYVSLQYTATSNARE